MKTWNQWLETQQNVGMLTQQKNVLGNRQNTKVPEAGQIIYVQHFKSADYDQETKTHLGPYTKYDIVDVKVLPGVFSLTIQEPQNPFVALFVEKPYRQLSTNQENITWTGKHWVYSAPLIVDKRTSV